MIIDFALGGEDLLKKTPGIADALGPHEYEFDFKFGEEYYRFTRRTDTPGVVLARGDDEYSAWPLDQYREWLAERYGTNGCGLSFRSVVSPFIRVWGRDTLEVQAPLRADEKERAQTQVERLLGLFDRLVELRDAKNLLATKKKLKSALRAGQREGVIPKINASTYKKNAKELKRTEEQLDEIRQELETAAVNISSLMSDEMLELKSARDAFAEQRQDLLARKERLTNNLYGIPPIARANLELLRDFFPSINIRRLEEIEGFHRDISLILMGEISEGLDLTNRELELIETELERLDQQLASLLRHVDTPSYIVDKVVELASVAGSIRQANDFYDQVRQAASDEKSAQLAYSIATKQEAEGIKESVNRALDTLTELIFPAGRHSPRLSINEKASNYTYKVPSDHGTGTAYVALLIFDLVVLKTTARLPLVVHDSVLFKNIENDVIASLVKHYQSLEAVAQVFIALDEVHKYGPSTASVLESHAVVRLTRDQLLYDQDWRPREHV